MSCKPALCLRHLCMLSMLSAMQTCLVLHEGDERRDDDADLARERRQNLVADAFAGTCRHDHQCVEAIQRRADDILQRTTKGTISC